MGLLYCYLGLLAVLFPVFMLNQAVCLLALHIKITDMREVYILSGQCNFRQVSQKKLLRLLQIFFIFLDEFLFRNSHFRSDHSKRKWIIIRVCWTAFIHVWIFLWFLSPVRRMMLSYGRRLQWRNCPGLFSLWSTVAAHTGNSDCSSTWNTRMLVLLMKNTQRQTAPCMFPLCCWSALLVSVSAGDRTAGRLHTCCSIRGLQWTVNPVYYKLCSYALFTKKKCKDSVISVQGGVGGSDPKGLQARRNVWQLPWQHHCVLLLNWTASESPPPHWPVLSPHFQLPGD